MPYKLPLRLITSTLHLSQKYERNACCYIEYPKICLKLLVETFVCSIKDPFYKLLISRLPQVLFQQWCMLPSHLCAHWFIQYIACTIIAKAILSSILHTQYYFHSHQSPTTPSISTSPSLILNLPPQNSKSQSRYHTLTRTSLIRLLYMFQPTCRIILCILHLILNLIDTLLLIVYQVC